MATQVLFPVGRLVWGSISEPRTKDIDGRPRLDRNNQPKTSYDFGVAIPKNGTTHWAQTQWGQIIWNEGHTAFRGGQAQLPTFSWKITDGDSQVPNKRGNKPIDQEGYAGCWVLSFSSQFPPKCCNADGSQIINPTMFELGYYVQVAGSVASNDNMQSPGVYLNHQAVALSGYGEKIQPKSSIDTATVGFGGPLPDGASAVPIGMTVPLISPPHGAPLPPAVPTGFAPHGALVHAPAPPTAIYPSNPHAGFAAGPVPPPPGR